MTGRCANDVANIEASCRKSSLRIQGCQPSPLELYCGFILHSQTLKRPALLQAPLLLRRR